MIGSLKFLWKFIKDGTVWKVRPGVLKILKFAKKALQSHYNKQPEQNNIRYKAHEESLVHKETKWETLANHNIKCCICI
jgi:hypothetical protein